MRMNRCCFRRQIGRDLLRDRFEADDSGIFIVVDGYGKGNEREILRHLLRTHDLMTSLADPQDWLKQARRASPRDVWNAGRYGFGPRTLGAHPQGTSIMRGACQDALRQAGRLGYHKSVDYLQGLQNEVESWARTFFEQGLDGLVRSVNSTEFARRPPKTAATPSKWQSMSSSIR